MKVFGFLLIAMAAADENSLLQAEVREHARLSEESVALAINTIGKEIGALKLEDLANKMAMDALMHSVAKVTKLTPEAEQVIGEVKQLLQDILNTLKGEKSNADISLNHVNTVVAACNTQGDATDTTLRTSQEEKKTNHTTCRAEQVSAYDADSLACTTLTNWMDSYEGGIDCVTPTPTYDHVAAWDTLIFTGEAWFTSRVTQFSEHAGPCETSAGTLTEKAEECNDLQTGFESAFCLWYDHRHTTQTDRTECWNNAKAAHDLIVDSATPNSEQRVKEARLIEHLICLITNLLSGETDLTLCVDQADSYYENLYGNPPVVVTAIINVDLDEVAVHPGSTTWNSETYTEPPLDLAKTPLYQTGVDCLL